MTDRIDELYAAIRADREQNARTNRRVNALFWVVAALLTIAQITYFLSN